MGVFGKCKEKLQNIEMPNDLNESLTNDLWLSDMDAYKRRHSQRDGGKQK